ncbi:retrovirus-related pol polyprotein from transposon TNT 1-94 [Tanacetum coccineum]|uniref:Retrovirus-related pol polyprotein from transposon TNT 1-94 n=1 Tax=Tanacetum coccineum TaxID=301880 RepID=A0ABQ5CXC1_9ASTR
MGPFPSSRGNKYILVAVDCLSKWVEAKALPTNNARVVVKFLKSLFARFGTPRAIISDRGTHFCNDQFAKVVLKYGVTHRLSTAYHLQTSRQVRTKNDRVEYKLNAKRGVVGSLLSYRDPFVEIPSSESKVHIEVLSVLWGNRLPIPDGSLPLSRVGSINGKRYVLVIVDDYSRYAWVHFLISKDEAPEVIKTFLKKIQVLLQAPVIIIRTENRIEFTNQVLKAYFDSIGISSQMSSVRTPQQNRIVERRNQTLVEAARALLIFSCAPLFLWAETISTACYTQNRSLIHQRFDKIPYELINGRKSDIFFLHVFGALCHPNNDREDIGKLGAKGDIGFFICYSANFCAYIVYNRRTKNIMETMNVTFDKLSAMAFEQRSSKPELQGMTSGHITMYDDYIGGQLSAATRTAPAALAPQVLQTPTASTTTVDSAPTPINSSSQATTSPNTSQDVKELQPQTQHPCLQAKEGTLWVKVGIEGMAQPTEKHLKEVKRIFCYLRGTVNMGLWYCSEPLEKGDSNVIPDSPNMCDNDFQNDQNDVECDDERVALANLITNLKLDVDENKKIQKKLRKQTHTLAHELIECKYILRK